MKALLFSKDKGIRKDSGIKKCSGSLLKIGGKTILQHQIELLEKYKVTDIHILIKQADKQVKNLFDNGNKFGVQINYIEQTESEIIGDAIKKLSDELKDELIIIDEGVMINMDIERLTVFHKKKESGFR